ncbi:Dehydrosqualene desaturase [Roseimaritima ulvae]|uniref:Dehydrosqualene desaturase n=2 Tax=Roseimaritima ulvae TaxID=980254 RepID=A0A5B9QIT9_9BACT|nr:Dehydrosqualene desaturase [Roseimaritima ulvae]
MQKTHVVIVGAGLAGLACATRLAQQGVEYQLLEATDRVGGRLQTDSLDGFLLDHGFQYLRTDAPIAQRLLDDDALRLRPFAPADERLGTQAAAVPASGIEQIPQQLARALPADSLRLQATVEAVAEGHVQLTDGSALGFNRLVLATEASAADRLASGFDGANVFHATRPVAAASTVCYFAADELSVANPLLFSSLVPAQNTSAQNTSAQNTSAQDTSAQASPVDVPGIERVLVISQLAAEYAPPEKSLISVQLAGTIDRPWQQEAAVRRQLRSGCGLQVDAWRLLRTYALPEGVGGMVEGALETGWQAAGDVLGSLDLH